MVELSFLQSPVLATQEGERELEDGLERGPGTARWPRGRSRALTSFDKTRRRAPGEGQHWRHGRPGPKQGPQSRNANKMPPVTKSADLPAARGRENHGPAQRQDAREPHCPPRPAELVT